MHPPEVQLSIDSQFENIELVQIVIEQSLQDLDLDEDSRYWIGIAVGEAVANAIKHGNRLHPEKQVTIGVRVKDDVLEISVRDQGAGFVPARVDDPLDPQNLLKPNGRGIFYMRRLMDEIEYSFGREGGTLVTLKKRIGPMGEEETEDEDYES